MSPEAGNRAAKRLAWIAGVVAVWGACIFAKIILLQVVQHSTYVRLARQQQERLIEIPAPRGSIYDRTGQPLAMSVRLDSVSVNPLRVPNLEIASGILSGILEMDRTALYGRLKSAFDSGRGFLWVKRKLTPEQSRRLHSLRLDWIDFQAESERRYPKERVAANVLGSVDREEEGNGGLEAALDDELAGHAGTAHVLSDVKRRGIDSQLEDEPHAGASITLTLDERIQFVAEKEIAAAVQERNAKFGSVVVMNPSNGEILAMASYPTFDPNKPPQPGEPASCRFNHAVSVPFEPGSVFKVITLSAALETTDLRPESIINCGNGAITLFGRTIHEAHRGYGSIPMAMVLARSSNIGAIQVGMRVGQEKLYEYVRRFGFGQKTGITLPAESAGMVRKLSRWGATSLSSVSMGHEIGTTTLQLAQACSVVANGGLLVRPKIILKKDGQPFQTEAPRRVLRPETAITMRQLMEGVVVHPAGTGHKARLEGYSSGGKTGSAQIYDFATKHYSHTYNGSFMGFAPVSNPAIVVVVTVNGTHGTAGFGGQVAAPVFKAVAEEALRVLDIPKDLPDTAAPGEDKKKPEVVDDLAIADLGSTEPPELDEPSEGTAPADRKIVVAVESGPKVPNFRGKTMRAVLAEASARGLPVMVDGNGVARGQQPAPGAVLHSGERIRVQFAR